MEARNGVKLAAFIQIPIMKDNLDLKALIGWEKTQRAIKQALAA